MLRRQLSGEWIGPSRVGFLPNSCFVCFVHFCSRVLHWSFCDFHSNQSSARSPWRAILTSLGSKRGQSRDWHFSPSSGSSPTCAGNPSAIVAQASPAFALSPDAVARRWPPSSPDHRLRCSGTARIHHEDPKNTKGTGTTHSLSVLYKVDRTPNRLSLRSFVAFVHFVVILGDDLGLSSPTIPCRCRN